MKRAFMIVIAVVLCALVPATLWAAMQLFANRYGSISISDSGIVSERSELVAFGEIVPTERHSLGSVNFTVGPLLDGSLEGGGRFSSFGSSFVVTGNGIEGVPKGPLFVGAYVGKAQWTLVSEEGQQLVFHLTGRIHGTLYTGITVDLWSKQTIVTTKDQLNQGIGHIESGKVIAIP